MQANRKESGEKISVAGVEALFSEFEALYGARFADMWKGTDITYVKTVWAQALAGFKVRDVRAALAQCRFKAWPPSLPEFLGLCSTPPDPERAFAMAQILVSRRSYGEDVWPEKSLYWAAVEFGFFDLRSMSWPVAKNRWTRIWLEKYTSEDVLPPVPEPVMKLVSPGKLLTDRATAKGHLTRLKRLMRKRDAGSDGMEGG